MLGVFGHFRCVDVCLLADISSKLAGLLPKLAGLTPKFQGLSLKFIELLDGIPRLVYKLELRRSYR
ncbi:hypothetical protein AWM68_01790 [Fictibacillus phosphorivorans]|uniref:Uncharacterized protein n=1 Tax=Fictibacillus phosphorivorans TaxID=1221500 RepID=A0A161TIL4_9BACL|nr:hypothetical protein AWM68_01790 [Fictibacillus phosphorivorans]